MQLDELLTKILGAGGFLAGLAAVIGSWRSRRAGVRSDEREARAEEYAARRDTIADRDGLIDQLQEQMKELLERVGNVEKENTRWRGLYEAEKDYNLVLRDSIYRGGGTPPPRPS